MYEVVRTPFSEDLLLMVIIFLSLPTEMWSHIYLLFLFDIDKVNGRIFLQ